MASARDKILAARDKREKAAIERAGKTGSTRDPREGKSVPAPKVSKPKITQAEGRPRGGFYGGMTRDKGK
jgi:hypothetical protein